MSELKIRNLTQTEVATAVDWARQEGWNPGLHDPACFFAADQQGFFGGFLGDELVAVGSAILYDPTFAFCGLYIVRPDMRGKGYGMALTDARLRYCGDAVVGIDGVLENEAIYGRIGYLTSHENRRYQFTAGASESPASVRELTAEDREAVDALDRECFPAKRTAFLDAWLSPQDGVALGCFRDGALTGYAVRRKCQEGHKIGPLFARDAESAAELFAASQVAVEGQKMLLDVPDNNRAAIELAESVTSEVVFATKRMYRNGAPKIKKKQVFGITTFELG